MVFFWWHRAEALAPVPTTLTDLQLFINRPLLVYVAALQDPEKAIVARIAAEYNTGCHEGHCALVTALTLNEQCSPKHQALLKQWFNGVDIPCSYAPDNAPSYQALNTLVLNRQQDNIWNVYLKYTVFERGEKDQCFLQKRSIIQIKDVLIQTIDSERPCKSVDVP
jgi:hypothetical protein